MNSGMFFVGWLVLFVVISLIGIGGAHLDLWMNPWLYEASSSFRWYNYAFSYHAATHIYMLGIQWWLLVAAGISLLFNAIFWAGWSGSTY